MTTIAKIAPAHSKIPGGGHYEIKAFDCLIQPGKKTGPEIHVKKFAAASSLFPGIGKIICGPGIATDHNLFGCSPEGEILNRRRLNTFVNVLAAIGFSVYVYNPGYTVRAHNRYVNRFCADSLYFGKEYKLDSSLGFHQLVDEEIPLVVDFVMNDGENDSLSGIMYSLAGMVSYAYLARNNNGRLKNLVTIGTPVNLTQLITRLFAVANVVSSVFGLQEKSFAGHIAERFIPFSRLVSLLPGVMLRYNLPAAILYTPWDMHDGAVKRLFTHILEPVPASLEHFFVNFIRDSNDYLREIARLKGSGINFLFVYGELDFLAPPSSVKLARALIDPEGNRNIFGIAGAGHLNLMIGKRAKSTVWLPIARWLVEKSGKDPDRLKIFV